MADDLPLDEDTDRLLKDFFRAMRARGFHPIVVVTQNFTTNERRFTRACTVHQFKNREFVRALLEMQVRNL